MNYYLLILLAMFGIFQNMAFTASSRSRNSGDPSYHFFVAIFSNGIWFAMQMFYLRLIWKPLMAGDWRQMAIVGVVYCLSTASGSSLMMHIMKRFETGARAVGAKAVQDAAKKGYRFPLFKKKD